MAYNIHRLIIFFLFLLLFSCTAENRTQKKEQSKIQKEQAPIVSARSLYVQHCGTCHQVDGYGVQGMYPPLAENEHILDTDYAIRSILNGVTGRIEVNGETYENEMPAMDYLKDEEIVQIINYVRSAFNNYKDSVQLADVSKLRKSEHD